jgi:hypothetical protein
MSAIPQEVQELIDRERIRDCIARLARGEDRRDAGLISSAFWPDANTDFGIFAGSFDQYLAWVVPGAAAILVTQHILGQTLIKLDSVPTSPSKATSTAASETHVTSYHRINMGSEEHDVVIGGRYLDKLESRGGDWRIAQRTMLYDWLRDFGVSADLSKGLMGTDFSAAHFAGKAAGDYSETFFGKKRVS